MQLPAGSFDTNFHIFFASHYAHHWFDPWNEKWFAGFSQTTYPPLTHQWINGGYVVCEKPRSEEHTSELQSRLHLLCRLLPEKKKTDACSTTLPLRSTQLSTRRLLSFRCSCSPCSCRPLCSLPSRWPIAPPSTSR